MHLMKFNYVYLTLIWRPLNKESSIAMAVLTESMSANSIYANPFGWPSNLLHNMVTRFIEPHPWKWVSNSSAVAA